MFLTYTYTPGNLGPNCTIIIIIIIIIIIMFVVVFLALQPTVVVFSQPSSGFLPPRFRGFLITHNDAPQSVGFLWTNDQSVAEFST